ncbi:MAG: hypothetical protein J0M34_01315 [Alphaproteobacteria bacterium]|nr:hypothetical protein [Alphaproteobacteria bacterium]
MTTLSKLWAGRVFGTNTGNIFIEFTELEPEIKGILRFMDTQFGVALYDITGTFDGKLKLKGVPTKTEENVTAGELTAEADLTAEGNIQGKWETTLGTGGAFTLFPHDETTQKQETKNDVPEQIHTKNIALGSIRLFAEDVRQLLEHVKRDFTVGKLIVTYNNDGSEITDYAENFLQNNRLGILSYLKINIQEPDAYGINRSVVIELRAHSSNDIRVQGVQQSWVIGKAESLAVYLRRYQSPLATSYKKFGLGLNQLIFFAMLVVMPSVAAIKDRVFFALSILALLQILLWVHTRYIPMASVTMSEKQPNWFSRSWPVLVSWFSALCISLVGSYIFYWLQRG